MFRLGSTPMLQVLLLGALLFSVTGSLQAAECKGLSSKQCAADAACAWVDGYQRKDGRTVSGYCRTKPKMKAEKKKAAKPKAGKTQQ
ncbi:MAG: hypothetical protein ABW086_13075 [Sedimenticola sp.]